MQAIKKLVDFLQNKFFADTYQLQRIVLWLTLALVLAVVSFGGYYYADRYHRSQMPVAQQTLAQAEQAVRADPQNVDKRLALAEAFMLNGRWSDAIAQALEVQKAKPDDLRVVFVLGISYANSDQCQQAIEPLTQYAEKLKDADMLGLNKQYQAALYYLGDCYLRLGQPDKAIQPLVADVNLSLTDADAIYKLGLAYAGVQNYKDALASFHRAAVFVPDFTEAYQAMALAYDAINEPVKARYARAMVAYSQKDYGTAYVSLTEVVKEIPQFAPAFTGLGLTCEAQNNLQCALDAYKAASQLEPTDFTANQGILRVEAALKK